MSWDTFGIVKVKGDVADLKRFIASNKSFIDLKWRIEGEEMIYGLLESFIAPQNVSDGYIYWKFLSWSFDGEYIIEHISRMFPLLEFHSRYGSSEQMLYIECCFINGILEDTYRVWRMDSWTDEIIEDQINNNYKYDNFDWLDLDITWTHKEFIPELKSHKKHDFITRTLIRIKSLF